MKIVYLNPPYGADFVRSARWAARSRGRVQRHPEQALIQIAVLERAGHICKFIEGAARNLSESQILQEIQEFAPDLAVIHTTTPSIYSDISYARKIKKLCSCRTILVGAHASAEPEDTLRKGKEAVDIIAYGEADYTLLDLANSLDLEKILGIAYLRNGRFIKNPLRPYLDVNDLPFPAWQHIDPRWYHDAGKLYPFLTLYTGRGCFGLCTFCRETQVINGRKVRMRSAKRVVDEIEHDLKIFPYLKEIMFETDTFTADPIHVQEVCNEIIKRRLDKKISWSCNVRVDVRLDLLPLMKKAGCRMLMVGFEFGTNEQLQAVKKGTTIEIAKKFAETAHSLGFIIHGCFMVGAPNETKESAQKTIDFAKSLPLDTIQVSGIAVYPGTEFYEWAKKNHYLAVNDWPEWVDENGEQVTVLNYPQMPREEINYYIDKALREFYLRPKQIARMILKIRSWEDIKRKAYGLRSFTDYFFKKGKKNENCCSC